MGKLSGSHQDQGRIDSGQWREYRSGIGFGCPNGTCTYDSDGIKSFSAFICTCKDKGELCEYRVLQRIEGMPEIHELRALEAACREVGGLMLAITGATRLYYVAGFTDMRYGKYALANVVRYQLHRNPYNGDGYMFMSKDRQKMKILVYSQ